METKWKKKKENMDNHRVKFANIEPSNLMALPLQNIFAKDIFTKKEFKKDTKKEFNGPNVIEGFNLKQSRGDLGVMFKPIVVYIELLIYWINQIIFEYPGQFIEFISETICEIVTANDDTKPTDKCTTTAKTYSDSDYNLIKTNIQNFIAILISCFVIYNWYFLMFYQENKRGFDERIAPLFTISTDALSDYNNIIGFLFKYLIVPVSLTNSIIINRIPNLLYIFNNKLQFSILFLLVVNIAIYYGPGFIQSLLTYMKFKTDSKTGIMIAIMVLFGVFSLFRVRFSLHYFQEVFRYLTPVYWIVMFISFMIRITISIVCVWFAGILVMLYILLLSFFAIPIYNYDLIDTIDKINKSVFKQPDTSDCPCDTNYQSPCNPKTIWSRMHDLITWINDHIYIWIFEMVFIFYLIQGAIQYAVNMKNTKLKTTMVIFNIIVIFIFAYIGYAKPKIQEIEKNIKPDETDDKYKDNKSLYDIDLGNYNKLQDIKCDTRPPVTNANTPDNAASMFNSLTGMVGMSDDLPVTSIPVTSKLPSTPPVANSLTNLIPK